MAGAGVASRSDPSPVTALHVTGTTADRQSAAGLDSGDLSTDSEIQKITLNRKA